MDLNVIKITADAFDWTIEKTAQSLQTFLDGNYYVVAYIISFTYAVLKSIAETVSFSGYVLRCYYLDFLAFLSELSAGVSVVFAVIYTFCSRIVLSVLSTLGCITAAISSLYFNIVFGFHLVGYYITLCVEEFAYFLNVCFAAVLIILQLGPNFLIFLWNLLLYCVTSIINYICITALSFLNFCVHLSEKSLIFILTIPAKAYLGLLILLYVFYARTTILKYLKLTLILLTVVAAKIAIYLWTAVKILFSCVQVVANKIFKRRTNNQRTSEGTLNLFYKNVFNRYVSNFVSSLIFSIFRREQKQVPDSAEKEKFMCVVCQDKEKNVLLIPCRHLCMCEECTVTVLQSYLGCPLCRKQILDTSSKPKMISKIVSGGQTGVDQAALFVGTEMGVPVGGWCPLGGLDENNKSILEKYPLKEVTGFSFEESIAERTLRNIDDSDGTLIIVPSIPLLECISDGTLLTIKHVKEKQKPYLLIAVSESDAASMICNWIKKHHVKILNVAGPRESSSPGIYDQSCKLLQQFLLSENALAQ